jgi:Zn-finger nucleic acid-binding protein
METKVSKPMKIQLSTGKWEEILKCPKCKTINMDKSTNQDGVTIDICPTCGGMWLDKNELINVKKLGFIKYVRNYFRKDA